LAVHTELVGKFNVVYTGSVLHVLVEAEIEQFLKNIYDMLTSGGIYFGTCGVADSPGTTDEPAPGKENLMRYIHSLESLKSLLEKTGFLDVDVQITAGSEKPPGGSIRRMVMYFGKKK